VPENGRCQKKAFFFEKKKQKTFVILRDVAATRLPKMQKFLVLFSKRTAFFCPSRYVKCGNSK
jgi:hypothetical protein